MRKSVFRIVLKNGCSKRKLELTPSLVRGLKRHLFNRMHHPYVFIFDCDNVHLDTQNTFFILRKYSLSSRIIASEGGNVLPLFLGAGVVGVVSVVHMICKDICVCFSFFN